MDRLLRHSLLAVLVLAVTASVVGGVRAAVLERIPVLPIRDEVATRVGRLSKDSPRQPTFHPVSLPALRERVFDGRELKLGRVLARQTAYTRYSITYRSGELKISGIMNVPKGKGPFPGLILNHGYIDPTIYTNGRGLKREQDYLARRGYVVLHPDYRNHASSDKEPDPELRFRLGYTEDVINAILAVKNSGLKFIDPSRIGMLGHSMGGGIALNVMVTRPDLVSAVVLFAPVSADARDNFERWTKRRPKTAEQIIATYGVPKDNPAFWDNLSAVNFLDAVQAPVMVHHGTADKDVPIEWSQRLTERLNEAGKDVEFHVYRGAPHEFIKDWPLVMRRTAAFFNQHLKPNAPTPSKAR